MPFLMILASKKKLIFSCKKKHKYEEAGGIPYTGFEVSSLVDNPAYLFTLIMLICFITYLHIFPYLILLLYNNMHG